MRFLVGLWLACLLLSACNNSDPDSPQGRRQALFKQMLANSEALGGMLRGRLTFDGKSFSEGARRLDELAAQPWAFFPPPESNEQGRVDEHAQRRQEQFAALAQALEASTAVLREAAEQPQMSRESLQEPLDKVESSCKRCHEAFRAF
jgi:cytochrome c556